MRDAALAADPHTATHHIIALLGQKMCVEEGLSVVRTGAKWVDGMEVGEEYTYIRLQGNKAFEVRCQVLSIQPDGTCTVDVLSATEVDRAVH